MDAKTTKLRTLCTTHHLTPEDVCTLTGRGISVVHHWMSGRHKRIPDHMLELLELKVAQGLTPEKEA